jgi:hypothetical protein
MNRAGARGLVFFLIGLGALSLAAVSGCSRTNPAYAASYDRLSGPDPQSLSLFSSGKAAALSSEPGRATEEAPPAVLGKTRKLVKSADLRLRVDDPEASGRIIAGLLEQSGAYAESTQVYENSVRYRLRAPAALYDTLLAGISGIGKVLSRSESAEDVTLRFYDIDGRLETKREILKTFRGYLGKAENIGEIMTVEKRIAELQNEIDWLGSELAELSNLVDYAAINVELLGPVFASPHYKPGIGERVTGLFRSFGDYASTAVVVITGILIYGVPGALILALLFWLLLGKIGLLKKLWHLAAGKRDRTEEKRGPESE